MRRSLCGDVGGSRGQYAGDHRAGEGPPTKEERRLHRRHQLPGFAEKKKPADIKQEDVTSSSERQPEHLEDLSDSEASLLGRGCSSLW